MHYLPILQSLWPNLRLISSLKIKWVWFGPSNHIPTNFLCKSTILVLDFMLIWLSTILITNIHNSAIPCKFYLKKTLYIQLMVANSLDSVIIPNLGNAATMASNMSGRAIRAITKLIKPI